MANNIVGLKPSLGLVPTEGVVPACRSLDCVSVFALTVADAAAVLEVMAGPAPEDRYSRAAPARLARRPGRPARLAAGGAAGRRSWSSTRPDDAALYEAALARAVALGGTIDPVDIAPFLAIAQRLYDGAWVAERTAALRGHAGRTARQPPSGHPRHPGRRPAQADHRCLG